MYLFAAEMQLIGIFTVLISQQLCFANVIPIRHDTERLVMTEDERSLIMDSNTVKIEQTPRNKPIGRIEIRLNTTKSMVIIEENSASSAPSSNIEEKPKAAADIEASSTSKSDTKVKNDDGDKATLAITLKENDNNEKANKTESQSAKATSATTNHMLKVENYAELPIDDDEEDDDVSVEEVPLEKCFRNKNKLSEEVLAEMKQERRKLKRTLKRLRAQLKHFCALELVAENRAYRGCQQWRVDFSVNYFKFYRLLYCSTIEDWPHSREVQQSMGEKLQLYQDVYAFTADR